MSNGHVFISHATADDDFVSQLHERLEGQGITVWVDSRNLCGGDQLAPAIQQAIAEARQFIVVLSPRTINSPWVRREIQHALATQQLRSGEDYRVIPILLPGVTPYALPLWFAVEPAAIPVPREVGGVGEALAQILTALGEQLPHDIKPPPDVDAQPLEELILELQDPMIQTAGGTQRAEAIATLVYRPANYPTAREVRSRRFPYTAPLGPIEVDELRWYLESYALWPTGVFKERAERIEGQLPVWGQQLYQVTLGTEAAQEALRGWQQAAAGAERSFSVSIDDTLPQGSDADRLQAAQEAAVELLALPWELLHDTRTYLFEGRQAVRVRRRLPNRHVQQARVTALPIRILLVSPRPEDETTGYIDHRISSLALVQAIANLGELVELAVLTPPTFPALREALGQADQAGTPFDVVHFDGHGVYDRRHGLGQLCFEDPNDTKKLQQRRVTLISAQNMAGVMRDSRIPLVFLEACQTAVAEDDPRASVAAKLLEEGVTSVVAMSHSVLVETARRFVEAFYGELARGARVGQAMLVGQQALEADTSRGQIMGAGALHLQDWFVPVLYQEEHDPQLFDTRPSKEAQRLRQRHRERSLGALPEPPPHTFVGRSRALLALERLLHDQPYAVIVGQGGVGKTALAVELARWLVRTDRFQRAAFVSLETYTDGRGVVDSLGQQLLPEGENWSVAQFDDLGKALRPIERALRDHSTLMVLDNIESVLPDATGTQPPAATPIEELLALFQGLLRASSATWLVITSREGLPAPFDHPGRGVRLGALSRVDAIALVSHVLSQAGLAPASDDAGGSEQEIDDLVESVNCHPRALVLLAREVSQRGVRATTEELRQLMSALDAKHPGDRENSLYASVELSLRRLSPEVRKQIASLAVFHGGANLAVWAMLLEADPDVVEPMAAELIGVGLAESERGAHLRLDPALSAYLLGELEASELDNWQRRWAEGMGGLRGFLSEQQHQDVELSNHLTVLELPNLLAWLAWLQARETQEEVALQAVGVENLLTGLGRPRALAQVVQIRQRAAQGLDVWGHAHFEAERASMERLVEHDDLPGALSAADRLLQTCLAAGDTAYAEAPDDIALAHVLLGRMVRMGGAAEAALSYLDEGQRRFEALAEARRNDSAARMVSVAIIERGDCLTALGRLDEAATTYEVAIERAENRGWQRNGAIGKVQLGTVRMLQGRYAEALAIYTEARETCQSLGEPGSVAHAWHGIGIVHRQTGEVEQAEAAHRQALAIWVQQQDLVGEANSLHELGNLYGAMGRLEEAATFYRQAADTYVTLKYLTNEGRTRSNLADKLIKLQRYDDARRELQRAMACKEPYGHAAEPWSTWKILHDLEHAAGNPQAAADAQQQAIQCYIAYRRDGGESPTTGAKLCTLVAQAIQQGETTEVAQGLAQLAEREDIPPKGKVVIAKLQAVLHGNRDLALAADPALDFDDAVELQLLLENLT